MASTPFSWQAALTRRQVLKLGAIAVLTPRQLLRPGATWSFAVFSDTHYGIPENAAKNRALLEEIAGFAPELAINIGDVTERGWAVEYEEVGRGFGGLPFQVRCAPGNHDVRWAPLGLQLFEERVGPPRQVFEHRGCVFAVLDSTVPLSHWGHVGGPQLRWLQAELEKYPATAPVFAFLHHAPGRTPPMLDDEYGLAQVLGRFNTKIIFTGHGHADLVWDWAGASCTMGKGLYQGSYQRVEVGEDAVRVFRRTPAAGLETGSFLTLPLARGERVVLQPPRAGEPAGELRARWSRALPGGVMSHLLLDRGILFATVMDGSVLAVNAKDGKTRWQARTEGYCHSSPVLAGNRVLAGSADAHVYAFDRSSGKQQWKVRTGGPVYGSAAIAKNIAAIASGDGKVYGLDVRSGAERWRFALPESPSGFSQSPAATDGERFFVGAWDRYVYALDAASGRELWRYQATPQNIYYSAAIAAPAVVDGRLYVPSNDGVLHALDAVTGAVVWTAKSPGDKFGYSSPTVVDGRIYIGCLGDKGEVRCLSAADGRELWVSATGATIYESSPAVVAGRVAIGSVNGTLWLLDAASGAITGSYRFPPGHFLSSPAAERGRVYAATLSETMVALDVRAEKR